MEENGTEFLGIIFEQILESGHGEGCIGICDGTRVAIVRVGPRNFGKIVRVEIEHLYRRDSRNTISSALLGILRQTNGTIKGMRT